MSKAEELAKHTLNLFPGDYAKIQALYPDTGAGPIIRRVIRSFIEKVESQDDGTKADVEIQL